MAGIAGTRTPPPDDVLRALAAEPEPATSWRFEGTITSFGTTAGVRLVIGAWARTPFGAFADVMAEHPDGRRRLLAPRPDVADFISDSYSFDEVVIVPIELGRAGPVRQLQAGPLRATFTVGARAPLGWGLWAVPPALAGWPSFASLTDPIARRALRGVRTRGETASGKRQSYCPIDLRRLDSARAWWDGEDLGAMAALRPAPRFGFSVPPPAPGQVNVRTTLASR